jgi:hypothetical protein
MWDTENAEVLGAALLGSTIGETEVFLFCSGLVMVRSNYDGYGYPDDWEVIQFEMKVIPSFQAFFFFNFLCFPSVHPRELRN